MHSRILIFSWGSIHTCLSLSLCHCVTHNLCHTTILSSFFCSLFLWEREKKKEREREKEREEYYYYVLLLLPLLPLLPIIYYHIKRIRNLLQLLPLNLLFTKHQQEMGETQKVTSGKCKGDRPKKKARKVVKIDSDDGEETEGIVKLVPVLLLLLLLLLYFSFSILPYFSLSCSLSLSLEYTFFLLLSSWLW